MLTYIQLINLKPKPKCYDVTAAPGLILRVT